ncbi:hypothetical protein HZS_4303, partial [Henneguya salminicola]
SQRIFKKVKTQSQAHTFFYLELEWNKKIINLKKFNGGSLVEFQKSEYNTEFDIEKVTFCEFKDNEISFCCAGSTFITHFNEILGYTSRILPFKVKEFCFIKENSPGLVFLSSDSYMNFKLFWLNSTLNDLFPLASFNSPNPIDYTLIDNILIAKYNYENILLAESDDYLIKFNIISKIPEGRTNCTRANNTDSLLCNSSITTDRSFSKMDLFPKKRICYTNNSSLLSHILDAADDSHIFNSCNNNNSLQLQHSIQFDTSTEKYVYLVKDHSVKIQHKISSETNYMKSFISENILNEKFLYLLQDNNLTIIPITTKSSTLLLENIIDIVELEDIFLVVLIDKNASIHLYSGIDYFCTIKDKNMDKSARLILSRFDKILIRNNHQFWILQFPILSETNKILDQFWGLLFKELNDIQAVKEFYKDFLIYLFQHFVENSSVDEIFSYFMCQFFNTTYTKPKKTPIHIIRMKCSMKSVESVPYYDYSKICYCFANIHLIIYKYLLKVYNSLMNSHDYLHFNLFKSILSSIYVSYKDINQLSLECNDLGTDLQLDIFNQPANSNRDEDEDEAASNNNNAINRQKNIFSCYLNKIYSKPIGRGCLNFGMGSIDGNESSFKLSDNNSVNYEAKLMVKDDNNVFFTLVIPLDTKDINATAAEWPKFHNGVAIALTNIRSNKSEKSLSKSPTLYDVESWIKQAISTLNEQEVGGFLYGCGLLGQLNQLPVTSPGFLLNFCLKNKHISISGVLLGLGASHIQCTKNESPLLVRRLQRIFFIHSGLSPLVREHSKNKPPESGKDVFDFDSIDTKMSIYAQASSIISLGLMYLSSADPLMLNILKRYFDTMMNKTANYKPMASGLKGIIPPPNSIYNHKLISIVAGISIGLINCNNLDSKNEFSWDKYYGSLINCLI